MQSRGLAEPGAEHPPEPSSGLGNLPFVPKPKKLPPGFEPNSRSDYHPPTGTADNPATSTSPRSSLPFIPQPTVADIGNKVESALGGKPLAPNVPLRQQMTTQPPTDLAEGHTPVQSSALKSYKYDPDAREFHAQYQRANKVHIFGDVSPEEAQAFEDAPSKGKAMSAIARNPE